MSDVDQIPSVDNVYDDIVPQFNAIAPAKAVTSLTENPDQGARALALSRSTGVAPEVIHSDLEGFEQEHKQALVSGIVKNNDYIAAYIRGNKLADVVSNDDYGNLDNASRAFSDTLDSHPIWGKGIPKRYIAEPLHLFDCCRENDGAAAIVMVDAERAADGDPDHRRAEADDQRDPCAVDQPRQLVTAEAVGAEPVLGGYWPPPFEHVHVSRARQPQQIGEDRDREHQHHPADRDPEQRAEPALAPHRCRIGLIEAELKRGHGGSSGRARRKANRR